MPLQNRVTPFGEIVAVAARGTMMGNRGRLHTPDRKLGDARWALRAWITCVLEFRGRQRTVMAPNSYTELFFLDEATSFAAGHRPCAECRRADYRRFRAAWHEGNAGSGMSLASSVAGLDRLLHAERVGPDRRARLHHAPLAGLPDGTMIADEDGAAWLLWRDALHRWTAEGYTERRPVDAREVAVITPASVVRAFTAGYAPLVHPTAER